MTNHVTRPLVAAAVCAALFAAAGCARKDAPPAAETTAAAAPAPAVNETREPNNTVFKPAFEGQTRAPAITSSFALDVATVATGFEAPWSVELLPDGRFLVTERPGRLRIVAADGKLSEPVAGLPKSLFDGQGGLLDVALDPAFASTQRIFWTYSEGRDGGVTGTAVASGKLVEDAKGARVEGVKVIFRQMPSVKSTFHYGSRIVFTPDGKQLYVALGERAIPEGRVQSQDLNSHQGKVVRLNLDGSVPKDNPFVGRKDAKPEIWSYGHRNVQAANLDAQGRLWTIEHGPRGGDELNRPEAGKNYGWPVIGYGIDYSGEKMHDASAADGMEQPVYYWDPVIAPSGLVFHSGTGAPEWQGNLFVGGMGSTKLVRLKLENDRVVGEEWLLTDRGARIRDVKEGPDGSLFVIADGAQPSLLKVTPKTGA
ncbi:MAG: PQQ-dependent sugar dehydrogenase [Steroidobacteraceae bacterium]